MSLNVSGILTTALACDREGVIVEGFRLNEHVVLSGDEIAPPAYSFLPGNWTLLVDQVGRVSVRSPIAEWKTPPWWRGADFEVNTEEELGADLPAHLFREASVSWAGVGPGGELGLQFSGPHKASEWLVGCDVWRIPGMVGSWDPSGVAGEVLESLVGASVLSVTSVGDDLRVRLDRADIIASSLPGSRIPGWVAVVADFAYLARGGQICRLRNPQSMGTYFVPQPGSLMVVDPATTRLDPDAPPVNGIQLAAIPRLRVMAADGRNRWYRAGRFLGSYPLIGRWVLWEITAERALLVQEPILYMENDGSSFDLDAVLGATIKGCRVHWANRLQLILDSNCEIWVEQPWRATLGNTRLDMESGNDDVAVLEGLLLGLRIVAVEETEASSRILFDALHELEVLKAYGRDDIHPLVTFSATESEIEYT